MSKLLLPVAKTILSTVLLFVAGAMANDGFTFGTLKNADFWKAAVAASGIATWKKLEDSPAQADKKTN